MGTKLLRCLVLLCCVTVIFSTPVTVEKIKENRKSKQFLYAINPQLVGFVRPAYGVRQTPFRQPAPFVAFRQPAPIGGYAPPAPALAVPVGYYAPSTAQLGVAGYGLVRPTGYSDEANLRPVVPAAIGYRPKPFVAVPYPAGVSAIGEGQTQKTNDESEKEDVQLQFLVKKKKPAAAVPIEVSDPAEPFTVSEVFDIFKQKLNQQMDTFNAVPELQESEEQLFDGISDLSQPVVKEDDATYGPAQAFVEQQEVLADPAPATAGVKEQIMLQQDKVVADLADKVEVTDSKAEKAPKADTSSEHDEIYEGVKPVAGDEAKPVGQGNVAATQPETEQADHAGAQDKAQEVQDDNTNKVDASLDEKVHHLHSVAAEEGKVVADEPQAEVMKIESQKQEAVHSTLDGDAHKGNDEDFEKVDQPLHDDVKPMAAGEIQPNADPAHAEPVEVKEQKLHETVNEELKPMAAGGVEPSADPAHVEQVEVKEKKEHDGDAKKVEEAKDSIPNNADQSVHHPEQDDSVAVGAEASSAADEPHTEDKKSSSESEQISHADFDVKAQQVQEIKDKETSKADQPLEQTAQDDVKPQAEEPKPAEGTHLGDLKVGSNSEHADSDSVDEAVEVQQIKDEHTVKVDQPLEQTVQDEHKLEADDTKAVVGDPHMEDKKAESESQQINHADDYKAADVQESKDENASKADEIEGTHLGDLKVGSDGEYADSDSGNQAVEVQHIKDEHTVKVHQPLEQTVQDDHKPDQSVADDPHVEDKKAESEQVSHADDYKAGEVQHNKDENANKAAQTVQDESKTVVEQTGPVMGEPTIEHPKAETNEDGDASFVSKAERVEEVGEEQTSKVQLSLDQTSQHDLKSAAADEPQEQEIKGLKAESQSEQVGYADVENNVQEFEEMNEEKTSKVQSLDQIAEDDGKLTAGDEPKPVESHAEAVHTESENQHYVHADLEDKAEAKPTKDEKIVDGDGSFVDIVHNGAADKPEQVEDELKVEGTKAEDPRQPEGLANLNEMPHEMKKLKNEDTNVSSDDASPLTMEEANTNVSTADDVATEGVDDGEKKESLKVNVDERVAQSSDDLGNKDFEATDDTDQEVNAHKVDTPIPADGEEEHETFNQASEEKKKETPAVLEDQSVEVLPEQQPSRHSEGSTKVFLEVLKDENIELSQSVGQFFDAEESTTVMPKVTADENSAAVQNVKDEVSVVPKETVADAVDVAEASKDVAKEKVDLPESQKLGDATALAGDEQQSLSNGKEEADDSELSDTKEVHSVESIPIADEEVKENAPVVASDSLETAPSPVEKVTEMKEDHELNKDIGVVASDETVKADTLEVVKEEPKPIEDHSLADKPDDVSSDSDNIKADLLLPHLGLVQADTETDVDWTAFHGAPEVQGLKVKVAADEPDEEVLKELTVAEVNSDPAVDEKDRNKVDPAAPSKVISDGVDNVKHSVQSDEMHSDVANAHQAAAEVEAVQQQGNELEASEADTAVKVHDTDNDKPANPFPEFVFSKLNGLREQQQLNLAGDYLSIAGLDDMIEKVEDEKKALKDLYSLIVRIYVSDERGLARMSEMENENANGNAFAEITYLYRKHAPFLHQVALKDHRDIVARMLKDNDNSLKFLYRMKKRFTDQVPVASDAQEEQQPMADVEDKQDPVSQLLFDELKNVKTNQQSLLTGDFLTLNGLQQMSDAVETNKRDLEKLYTLLATIEVLEDEPSLIDLGRTEAEVSPDRDQLSRLSSLYRRYAVHLRGVDLKVHKDLILNMMTDDGTSFDFLERMKNKMNESKVEKFQDTPGQEAHHGPMDVESHVKIFDSQANVDTPVAEVPLGSMDAGTPVKMEDSQASVDTPSDKIQGDSVDAESLVKLEDSSVHILSTHPSAVGDTKEGQHAVAADEDQQSPLVQYLLHELKGVQNSQRDLTHGDYFTEYGMQQMSDAIQAHKENLQKLRSLVETIEGLDDENSLAELGQKDVEPTEYADKIARLTALYRKYAVHLRGVSLKTHKYLVSSMISEDEKWLNTYLRSKESEADTVVTQEVEQPTADSDDTDIPIASYLIHELKGVKDGQQELVYGDYTTPDGIKEMRDAVEKNRQDLQKLYKLFVTIEGLNDEDSLADLGRTEVEPTKYRDQIARITALYRKYAVHLKGANLQSHKDLIESVIADDEKWLNTFVKNKVNVSNVEKVEDAPIDEAKHVSMDTGSPVKLEASEPVYNSEVQNVPVAVYIKNTDESEKTDTQVEEDLQDEVHAIVEIQIPEGAQPLNLGTVVELSGEKFKELQAVYDKLDDSQNPEQVEGVQDDNKVQIADTPAGEKADDVRVSEENLAEVQPVEPIMPVVALSEPSSVAEILPVKEATKGNDVSFTQAEIHVSKPEELSGQKPGPFQISYDEPVKIIFQTTSALADSELNDLTKTDENIRTQYVQAEPIDATVDDLAQSNDGLAQPVEAVAEISALPAELPVAQDYVIEKVEDMASLDALMTENANNDGQDAQGQVYGELSVHSQSLDPAQKPLEGNYQESSAPESVNVEDVAHDDVKAEEKDTWHVQPVYVQDQVHQNVEVASDAVVQEAGEAQREWTVKIQPTHNGNSQVKVIGFTADDHPEKYSSPAEAPELVHGSRPNNKVLNADENYVVIKNPVIQHSQPQLLENAQPQYLYDAPPVPVEQVASVQQSKKADIVLDDGTVVQAAAREDVPAALPETHKYKKIVVYEKDGKWFYAGTWRKRKTL